MLTTLVKRLAVAVSLTVTAVAATASTLPPTTVSWVQQTGTVSTTDTVEIWMRLSVDSSATAPLLLDGSEPFDLPQGWKSISGVYNYSVGYCTGTFWPQPPLAGCYDTASPYVFAFNTTGANSFNPAQAQINPGESRDYLFGTFTPQNGAVAPGSYDLADTEFKFVLQGTDLQNQFVEEDFSLGQTCADLSPSCAFTRTVIAVPEPQTYALFGAGLLAVGWVARRRTRATPV